MDKDNIKEYTLHVRRTARAMKGRKVMTYSSAVVVGDGKLSIGYATSKSSNAQDASKKAARKARKRMKLLSIYDSSTLPHSIRHKYEASIILLLSAKEGTGIVAPKSLKPIFEAAGIKNVYAKIHGSTNPVNACIGTIQALQNCKDKATLLI